MRCTKCYVLLLQTNFKSSMDPAHATMYSLYSIHTHTHTHPHTTTHTLITLKAVNISAIVIVNTFGSWDLYSEE